MNLALIRQRIASLLILTMAMVSIVGLCSLMGMNDMVDTACPLMSGNLSALCPMNGVDSTTSFLQYMTNVIRVAAIAFVILIIAALFVSRENDNHIRAWFKQFTRGKPRTPLHNYFLELYSRGILQPKLCA